MTWLDEANLDISTGDWWERWAAAVTAANDLMERCSKLHESRGLELGLARALWHAGDLRLVERCEAMEPDAIASLNSEYRSRKADDERMGV